MASDLTLEQRIAEVREAVRAKQRKEATPIRSTLELAEAEYDMLPHESALWTHAPALCDAVEKVRRDAEQLTHALQLLYYTWRDGKHLSPDGWLEVSNAITKSHRYEAVTMPATPETEKEAP